MNSASFLGMGPWPGGPQSLRPAPAATLPGAGRHNQVSWAGITLPSPARPGPGGGPGASEPVRLGARRGALLSSHSGWAPWAAQPASGTWWPKDPAPLCQSSTLTQAHSSPLLSSTLKVSRVNRNAF